MRFRDFFKTVRRGYQNHNIQPKQGCWYKSGKACALAMYALELGLVSTKDNYLKRSEKARKLLKETLGHSYLNGFISGFDTGKMPDEYDRLDYPKEYLQGKVHGYRTAKGLGLLS